jgi:tetratricopeptide (TPR) repeat protein
MFARVRRWLPGLVTTCLLASAGWAESPPVRAEAAKLNNLGVAMMNQQQMDKAVAKFDAACKLDPSLAIAPLNKGIALLNQQKLPEAEAALQQAATLDPRNPRVWYNLGLVHRGEAKTDEAIADFQKVLKIDPTDPDAYYFLGTFYSQQQDYSKAIETFQQALKINPLHASAEFGLARALQRSGNPEEAKVHLKKFEHLTRDKISAPISLTYGEQGVFGSSGRHDQRPGGWAADSGDVCDAVARSWEGWLRRNMHARRGWRWEVRHRFAGGRRLGR